MAICSMITLTIVLAIHATDLKVSRNDTIFVNYTEKGVEAKMSNLFPDIKKNEAVKQNKFFSNETYNFALKVVDINDTYKGNDYNCVRVRVQTECNNKTCFEEFLFCNEGHGNRSVTCKRYCPYDEEARQYIILISIIGFLIISLIVMGIVYSKVIPFVYFP